MDLDKSFLNPKTSQTLMRELTVFLRAIASLSSKKRERVEMKTLIKNVSIVVAELCRCSVDAKLIFDEMRTVELLHSLNRMTIMGNN